MKQLILIVIALFLSATFVQATNLALNGTMEPNEVDVEVPQGPWVMSVPNDTFKPGADYPSSWDHTDPNGNVSGSMATHGNGLFSDPVSYFEQEVTLKPGSWYTLTFWTILISDGEGLTEIERMVNAWHATYNPEEDADFFNWNTGPQNRYFVANGEWTKIEKEFNANFLPGLSETVTLRFGFPDAGAGGGYSTVLIDDVFLVERYSRIFNPGFTSGYDLWLHGGGESLETTSIVNENSILMSNAADEATAGETYIKQEISLDPGHYEIKLTTQGDSTAGVSQWAVHLYSDPNDLNGVNALRSYDIIPVDNNNTEHVMYYYCDTNESICVSIEPESGDQGQVYLDYFTMYEVEYGEPGVCGDPGTTYSPYDLNTDCYVSIEDLAVFVVDWLECTDPANENCN